MPLYKYLGAARHEIRAYASTVAYPTIEGYIEALRPAVAEGFTAAKFHPFGEADRDIELARAIRHEFPNLDLMIDPVCAYTLPEALRALGIGRAELLLVGEFHLRSRSGRAVAYLAGKLRIRSPRVAASRTSPGSRPCTSVEQRERLFHARPGWGSPGASPR